MFGHGPIGGVPLGGIEAGDTKPAPIKITRELLRQLREAGGSLHNLAGAVCVGDKYYFGWWSAD
jgi:hypothetical protein